MSATYKTPRVSFQGAGGKMQGSASMGGESINIEITVTSNVDSGIAGLQAVQKEVQPLGTAVADTGEKVDEATKSTEKYSKSLRSTSWDLMLTARSINMINAAFFGSNQMVREGTALLYGLGGVLRIITMVQKAYNVIHAYSIAQSAAKSVANVAEAGTTIGLAGAVATLRTVLGDPTAIVSFAAGAAIAGGIIAAYASTMPSYQKGGYVSHTGPYMLHKGETVVPAGANFSTININMSTGPISSSVDIDNMLSVMAKKILMESRRRGI